MSLLIKKAKQRIQRINDFMSLDYEIFFSVGSRFNIVPSFVFDKNGIFCTDFLYFHFCIAWR